MTAQDSPPAGYVAHLQRRHLSPITIGSYQRTIRAWLEAAPPEPTAADQAVAML